jgi:hypothetical protein
MPNQNEPPDFVTLGMFIIDEIHFPPPTPPVTNILGGAGSYSALGARLFSPPPTSKSVGWIVDCGSDFPAELRECIASWETGVVVRETPGRLTTRGWNGYGEGEVRGMYVVQFDAASKRLIMCSFSIHDAEVEIGS